MSFRTKLDLDAGIMIHIGELISKEAGLFAAAEDKPSHFGSRVYFDANPTIDEWLARVEPAGGRILVGKTTVGETSGYFAYIEDSEGNRVGLTAEA